MQKRIAKQNTKWVTAGSIALWLLVWQVASMVIGQELFLPSPLSVLAALGSLAGDSLFWQSSLNSLGRISLGFALGLVLGCGFAALAAAVPFVEVLLRPLMLLARATPVSSFIILALVWFSSRNISVFVSFWMVLPVLYGATLSGIQSTDTRLLEMAKVFHIGRWRKIRVVYLPALRPSLLAACELAYGMCWKSGVAAEVIGLPRGTVGERMYQAKIYLQMPQLFAWTAVVIFLSWVVGRLVFMMIRTGSSSVENATFKAIGTRSRSAGREPEVLRLDAVNKRYGKQVVLHEFSAAIQPGEHVALRGASGAGKTTVARLLMGLEQPDKGCVATGENLFGVVFQEDRLCESLSAVRNVALVQPSPEEGLIERLLAEVGLGKEDIYKPTRELSGGQKRRVALVRAVAAPCSCLILDEAFKGLDDVSRQQAFAFVLRHCNGRTLLDITHEESEAGVLAKRCIEV